MHPYLHWLVFRAQIPHIFYIFIHCNILYHWTKKKWVSFLFFSLSKQNPFFSHLLWNWGHTVALYPLTVNKEIVHYLATMAQLVSGWKYILTSIFFYSPLIRMLPAVIFVGRQSATVIIPQIWSNIIRRKGTANCYQTESKKKPQ